MITVQIDEEELLDQLLNRVIYWNGDDPNDNWIVNLYANYYQDLIDNGIIDNCEFDVIEIVDNDWVNNLSFYSNLEEAMDDFGAYWHDDRIVAELDTGEVLVSMN